MATSVAQRNANPGNIKHSPANKWLGLTEVQPGERGFCRFTAPTYGVRALGILIQNYRDKHGCNTVTKIMERYAPPAENDVFRYAEFVSNHLGVLPDDALTFDYDCYYKLVDAIHRYEAGYSWLTEAQIAKGLVMAGIEPTPRIMRTTFRSGGSRTLSGSAGVGISAALAEASDTIGGRLQEFAPFLNSDTVTWFATGLFALGLVTIVWARVDDHRRGLR